VIVVDVNLVAYLFIEGESTEAAEAVFNRDPEWAAPLLWRSEWRSILAGYMRREALDFAGALELAERAEALFRGREHLPDPALVLGLVRASTCSAYDCEYLALAEALAVPLVTSDRRLLSEFPGKAFSPEAFGLPT
jgi:predicted nucleic acid-binding protein